MYISKIYIFESTPPQPHKLNPTNPTPTPEAQDRGLSGAGTAASRTWRPDRSGGGHRSGSGAAAPSSTKKRHSPLHIKIPQGDVGSKALLKRV